MISPTTTREIGTPIIVSGIPYNLHPYSGVKDGAPIIVSHYGTGGTVEGRAGGGTPIVLNDRVRGYMDFGSTKQVFPAHAGRYREFDSTERIVPAASGVSFDSHGPAPPSIRVSFDSSRPAPPLTR
ncbi:uncharacterized protein H6S33_005284 [Morchella sextelata]|uniref:uncharacterized protein n=1 Tax=Morchella sextelata TaxID=1174677 RepID=UPI001D03FE51|nr:uncharacterized protein H6S33_005284 [Morchella sextelata]KAH0605302.1 hypothetical protein H6S33_005284 [Morchella sextelata]